MQLAEKIQFAIQVKPLLEELLRLVNLLQDGELSVEEILKLIAGYGVIISADGFTRADLLNILHSLQTVGMQISQCFNKEGSNSTATPEGAGDQPISTQDNPKLQDAFKQVFTIDKLVKNVEFVYTADANQPSGVASYNKDTKIITIQLAPDAFSICRKYYLGSDGKPEGRFVLSQDLPCPSNWRGNS